jgi:hypothetical protein
MAIVPSSPVTGGAQTGFTAPTYTIVVDNAAPNANSTQWAVSALGGTQVGVTAHSVSSPFTFTVERPANYRLIGVPNPATGIISNVPFNVIKLRVRKGATPASGQSPRVAMAELFLRVPAGSDTYDAANLKAMCSLLAGIISGQSANIGQVLLDGLI